MTVKEIVEKWLKDNGYDGLWSENGECGCALGENFMGCDCTGVDECSSGFKTKCDPETCPASGHCEYHIGPKKEKEKP